LRFKKPSRVSGLQIFWNREGDCCYAARQCRIVALTPDGKHVVAEINDAQLRSFDRRQWPPVTATGIRLEQPARQGAAVRPGIMWIREIRALRAPGAAGTLRK
jgi:hypothetical protein